MAQFKTQARVLDLLGAQQIANCPTAISELFKNAHDAYANKANLDVYPHHDGAVLWDDGRGMTMADLTSRWLVVGTPGKVTEDRENPPRAGFERRPIQGEKGIGRLAIATIGESLLLVSKVAPRPDNPDRFAALFLNWNIAQNLDLLLDDIEIPTVTFGALEELESSIVGYMVDAFRASLRKRPPATWSGRNASLLERIESQLDRFVFDPEHLRHTDLAAVESGTAFFIRDLRKEMAQLVTSGARDAEAPGLNVELVQLLSNFRNHFGEGLPNQASYEFDVDVRRWEGSTKTFVSVFSDWQAFDQEDLRSYDHKIDVRFDELGRVAGTLEIFRKPTELPPVEAQPKRALRCGPFYLRLWYYQGTRAESTLDDDQFALVENKLRGFGGLMIYRDGLRVLPYGRPEYDWLTFEERRSRQAGRYFFSYRRLFGFVAITDNGNPYLRDKSGREGLIENEAYRQFRQRLVDFFKDLAARYFFKNEAFEQAVAELSDSRGLVAQQQRKAAERRERLRKDLGDALEHMATSELAPAKLMESSLADLSGLQDPGPQDLTEALTVFRQKLGRLAGAGRVVVPANLSLKRDRLTRSMLGEYRSRKTSFDAICDDANARFTNEVRRLYPEAEEGVARAKLMSDARLYGQTTIGKAFGELKTLIDDRLKEFSEDLERFRREQIERVDRALLKATATSSVDAALLCNYEASLVAISAMDEAASDGVAAIKEKLEQLTAQLAAILEGDREHLVAAQTEAIDELNEEVNRNLELVQLGLSVEIIDHELNKLYRGTKAALKRLASMARTSPSAVTAVEQVRANFQHLEQRYKLMSPLYRGSYRTKSSISGEKIAAYVRNFLNDPLTANSVDLTSSRSFREFCVVEAQAVILPVFVNVIDNAIFWLRECEDRRVVLDLVDGIITVCDSGAGIDDVFFEEIFDPFYSTKPNGRGLGLYVARANLRRHGHDIWASNDPKYKSLSGACICIRFSPDSLSGGSSQ